MSGQVSAIDAAADWRPSRSASEARDTRVFYLARARNYAMLDRVSIFIAAPQWIAFEQRWVASQPRTLLEVLFMAEHMDVFGVPYEIAPGQCLRIQHRALLVPDDPQAQRRMVLFVDDVTDELGGPEIARVAE